MQSLKDFNGRAIMLNMRYRFRGLMQCCCVLFDWQSGFFYVADDLRVELWGPYLTISGARNGAAMGMRRPRAAGAAAGGKGIVLRRELDHGFFSSTWKLPVRLPFKSAILASSTRSLVQHQSRLCQRQRCRTRVVLLWSKFLFPGRIYKLQVLL